MATMKNKCVKARTSPMFCVGSVVAAHVFGNSPWLYVGVFVVILSNKLQVFLLRWFECMQICIYICMCMYTCFLRHLYWVKTAPVLGNSASGENQTNGSQVRGHACSQSNFTWKVVWSGMRVMRVAGNAFDWSKLLNNCLWLVQII